jgi:hypothetical protein
MDELLDFVNRFILFGEQYFKLVFERDEVQDEIIRLVTIEQLFEQGVDDKGDLIQPEGYAPYTIEYKKATGQRFDHVTLNDTGAFYDSFTVTVGKGSFTINANGKKEDVDLIEAYGNDILGLTEESKNALIEYVFEVIWQEVRNTISQ